MAMDSTELKATYDEAQKALTAKDWPKAARLLTRCAKYPRLTTDGAKQLRALAAKCRKAALPDWQGLVAMSTSRVTGTKVGLWKSSESWEIDPATPWTTTCEEHSTLVCHETKAAAIASMPHPHDWCEYCREMLAKRKGASDE